MRKGSNTAPSVMRRVAALAVVMALGAAGVFAQQNFDDVEVQSLHVQGNVHMLLGAGGNVSISVGDDGVLVVDTQFAGMAEKLIAEIREIAGAAPIRYIVNTHAHGDHIGGNQAIAAAGAQIIAGNFNSQITFRTGGGNPAFIMAHENTLNRFISPSGGGEALPFEAWPTDTFFTDSKDFFFNDEAIFLLHQPNAHTDGDVIVHFRESDVIAAGDIYFNNSFPFIDVSSGGSLNGTIDAVNNILDITVPADKQEGGTYVVPGHGRLADEADVVEYRDMLTIIRDRMVAMIDDGMTLGQVQDSRVVADYEGRYGAEEGFFATANFIENAYRSLTN
jgi:glyoxylase-like metal-dependent hydrolase (beta-lactamase superfamily II)